mgnify:CR=1 FL=1
MNFIDNFITKFHSTFIEKDRWMYLLDGLKTTLLITFFAVILGMVLAFSLRSSARPMIRPESWDF